MTRMPHDPWADWLSAEQRDAADEADRALREAFTALPRRHPSPQLHERLMLAAEGSRVQPQRQASERWVAAGLVLAALGLTATPLVVIAGFLLVSPGRVVAGVARTGIWLTEWLNAGASIWALLARTGGALGTAAMSPTGSSLVTGALLVASMALLVLNRYLPAERSES